MKTTENLVCALVEEAKALSYTPASLAAKTGLPYSACHKLMSYKTRRPTAETVLLLIEAVGFSIEVKDQDGNSVWGVIQRPENNQEEVYMKTIVVIVSGRTIRCRWN